MRETIILCIGFLLMAEPAAAATEKWPTESKAFRGGWKLPSVGESVTTEGDHVAAGFSDNENVYVSQSFDGGESWSGSKWLAAPEGYTMSNVDVEIAQGDTVVMYRYHFEEPDFQGAYVVFDRWSEGTWTRDLLPTDGWSGWAELFQSDEHIWGTAAMDTGIRFYRTPRGSDEWEVADDVSLGEASRRGAIAIESTNAGIHVVWISDVDGDRDVMVGTLSFADLTWIDGPEKLTHSDKHEDSVGLAVDEGTLATVFTRRTGSRNGYLEQRVHSRISQDGGATWADSFRVGSVRQPRLGEVAYTPLRPLLDGDAMEVAVLAKTKANSDGAFGVRHFKGRADRKWRSTIISDEAMSQSLDLAGSVQGRSHAIFTRDYKNPRFHSRGATYRHSVMI